VRPAATAAGSSHATRPTGWVIRSSGRSLTRSQTEGGKTSRPASGRYQIPNDSHSLLIRQQTELLRRQDGGVSHGGRLRAVAARLPRVGRREPSPGRALLRRPGDPVRRPPLLPHRARHFRRLLRCVPSPKPRVSLSEVLSDRTADSISAYGLFFNLVAQVVFLTSSDGDEWQTMPVIVGVTTLPRLCIGCSTSSTDRSHMFSRSQLILQKKN
jgi:hypothetical protein